MPLTKEQIKRFWLKVNKKGGNECWGWQGGKCFGYGIFWLNGKNERANRISYKIYYGEFNEKLFVCHSCDNPSCVNPKHLWLGTTQDNTKDRCLKGRTYVGYNEKSPFWKLKNEEIKCIKDLYLIDGLKQKIIANIFNINQGYVSRIINSLRRPINLCH